MDVDLIFRIAAIGIIVAVLNQVLINKKQKEFGMLKINPFLLIQQEVFNTWMKLKN